MKSDEPLDGIFVLASTPQAVPEARTRTVAALTKWGVCDAVITDAELIVSELVTNAVRHANDHPDPHCGVLLILTYAGLTVAVWDEDRSEPAPRQATTVEESGRGLLLVEALSDRWGYHLMSSGGKLVFARLALPSGGADLEPFGLASVGAA